MVGQRANGHSPSHFSAVDYLAVIWSAGAGGPAPAFEIVDDVDAMNAAGFEFETVDIADPVKAAAELPHSKLHFLGGFYAEDLQGAG